jgi:hypothetical protein
MEEAVGKTLLATVSTCFLEYEAVNAVNIYEHFEDIFCLHLQGIATIS